MNDTSEQIGRFAVRTTRDIDRLDFTLGSGLLTVVAQDVLTGAVLMVAHADRKAVELTLTSGEMHYRSRTRGLWHKGATSGNVQVLVSLTADCDGDALLARVRPAGPACHQGTMSCFRDEAVAADALASLDATIAARSAMLATDGSSVNETSSWTLRLLADANLRHKKLGEEAIELAMACMEPDQSRAAAECADLFYHALVALHAVGGSLDDVRRVLDARARQRFGT